MPGKIRSLLIVDDDAEDLEIFMDAVKSVNSEIICHTAADGEDALLKLQEQFMPLPDLIFSDLNMPRLDGTLLLQHIKKIESLRHLPVIIYSTSSAYEDRKKVLDLGAARYIIKPNNFPDLCLQLDTIFSQKWPRD